MTTPTHVGFIVDGNRRWAKARGLEGYKGHKEGYEVLKSVLIDTLHRGVTYASAYVFSTENWKRSKREVNYLMDLFVRVLIDDIPVFEREGIRVRIVGSRDRLSKKVVDAISRAEAATAHLTQGQLLLCLNYGGHEEITDAVRKIVESGMPAADITEETIESQLYVADVPPCDVIVRTGGERRLSNFMMWRSTYSELIFLDKQWPDMTKDDVTAILDEYARRQRRFGG